MARDPFAPVREFVAANADGWQERLLLGHWKIRHVFVEMFDAPDPGRPVSMQTTAVTEAMPQYLSAIIYWYLPSAVRKSDDELLEVLVHELVHVLLSPEQVLVDTKTDMQSAGNPFIDVERDALLEANHRQLELATEMTTRALLTAWADKESIG